MIPTRILDQVRDKATEGLALAKAQDSDGAIMVFQWCNKAFCQITGFGSSEVIGQRGTLLIGQDLEQETHLTIIERLMNWERFSIKTRNNRKDGDVLWQQITWTPLTDVETSERWWLWSLAEIGEHTTGASAIDVADFVTPEWVDARKQTQTIRYLEKENCRLQALATAVSLESNQDALTKLSNRRHFEVKSKAWISDLRARGTEFAVLYIDLDDFKIVNDTLGHDAGDLLLAAVADKLRGLCGDDDFIARLGGDEFVILKRLGDSALNISDLADEIVQGMQAPFLYEDKATTCSASVGVAIANTRMDRPERVVADADSALYHAKAQGKKRWSFFTEEMHASSIATKTLAADLLIASDRKAFLPFFQPLIDAATGQIASAEALVRWPHPTRGMLQPVEFLETAANIGILQTIDAIIFDHLRDALAFLDDAGARLPRVSVNVSAGRLADPSFIHDLKSSGIAPDRIIVEILESVYLEQMSDMVRWTIDELNDLGVTLAIDDFGTGHASIQGLLKIKPSILKIDRQFIQPIVDDAASQDLVSSIIGIGKSLGVQVVAEGIESQEHARLAREMRCDYLQGYHFGRPMSLEELKSLLVSNQGVF